MSQVTQLMGIRCSLWREGSPSLVGEIDEDKLGDERHGAVLTMRCMPRAVGTAQADHVLLGSGRCGAQGELEILG